MNEQHRNPSYYIQPLHNQSVQVLMNISLFRTSLQTALVELRLQQFDMRLHQELCHQNLQQNQR